MKTFDERAKEYYIANLLDGDDLYNCGKAIVDAKEAFEIMTEFFKEELKRITDKIEKDCNRKYSKDKPASYAFFRGYNKCKKEVIDIIKNKLI